MNTHTPICPKCGYDQRGEIATWETQCPVDGRCPECGLAFSWANVLNPNKVDLKWFVEHAKTKRAMVRRTIPTIVMLLIPNRYWNRVTMETGRSTKRFLAWFAVLMIVLHLIGSVLMIGAWVSYTIFDNKQLEQMKFGQPQNHVDRIDGMKTTMDGYYWANAIAEGALSPLVARYTFFEHQAGAVLFAFGFIAIGFACMWLILMCAFPTTRRRSQLRLIHVVRAAVVSGLTPMLLMELGRILDAIGMFGYSVSWLKGLQKMSTMPIAMALVVLTMVWVQWFWWVAIWVGWKIKARWYEMVLVSMASLGGLVIGGGLAWAVTSFGEWLGIWLEGIGI